MKLYIYCALFFAATTMVFSCKKDSVVDPYVPPLKDCYLYKVSDSANISDSSIFFYNLNHQVVKKIKFNNGSGAEMDSFSYSNNLLIYSTYKLNNNPASPFYAKTEYTYSGNVLAGSSYYLFFLGFNTYATRTAYTIDSLGRTAKIIQTALRADLGATGHTTRYVFDSSSNLSKVYFKGPTGSEYLIYEYSDYDNKPNPLYKHPPFTDYDFYIYGVDALSRNNAGKLIKYSLSGGVPVASHIYIYTRTYNSDGYLSKMNSIDLKVNNTSGTKYYSYTCQ